MNTRKKHTAHAVTARWENPLLRFFFVTALIFSLLFTWQMPFFAKEVTTEKAENVTGRTVPHYTLKENGGKWDGTHYYLNDKLVKDAFFCDDKGYTYYLQKDGTPMKDRLTYHPDGTHIIYLDSNGHEVFSNFANVKKSIAGEAIDDLCFFDVFGYMYVNNLTYNQAGTNLYYVNPYGVIERNGWFTFQSGIGGAAETLSVKAGDMGYANADGSLAVNCNMTDPNGRNLYLQANGVAVIAPSIIASTACKSAIEADVTLDGSGTGCHAKLVICTGTSAISYGLQYDACAVAPYTGKTMVMTENVYSNAAGGQVYARPGDIEVAKGQTYHLMLTVNEDGSGAVYLNNQMIGTYSNPGLANQHVYLRAEASGRINGDSVTARFENIKCKVDGVVYDKPQAYNNFTTNPTISNSHDDFGNITFNGYISGLNAGEDWDNRYQSVSGILQLNW